MLPLKGDDKGRQLQVSKRIGEATVKLMEQRCAVLEAL